MMGLNIYEKRLIMENVNEINKYSANALCCIEPFHYLKKKANEKSSYKMTTNSEKLNGKKIGEPIVTEIFPSVYYMEYPIYKKFFHFGDTPEFYVGVIQTSQEKISKEELKGLLNNLKWDSILESKLAYCPEGNEEKIKILLFDKATKIVYYVYEFEYTFKEGG